MLLHEVLKPENISVGLKARDKFAAILELIDLLHANGEVYNRNMLEQSVLERETTRTTGIGNGLAILHAKTSGVTHLILAFGRTHEPMDFGAIDGRPVTSIYLLASPPERTGPHIQVMASISRLLRIKGFREEFERATTSMAVWEVIRNKENAL